MATIGKSNLSMEDIKYADKDEKETLLEHDSEPDEDMIFNRPSTSNGISRADGKMDSVRIQIQEVTHVMRDNVMKVMERGESIHYYQVHVTSISSRTSDHSRCHKHRPCLCTFLSQNYLRVI
ncbi:uncharacterized protein LOC122628644 isoform X3 [Vespula pensylvanica]|uniref:uncharacterized protein LOC122628644 isoform X3 n=1 Tax=Vespula pensylvanica TaxID=30213 RepID=UPI001CBA4C88|nr:uncharacterized protein LOC122628644 isoform X3 [Vespula pensylvanica]